VLRLKSVHTYYGNAHILKGISLHVAPGELVAIIGANGAGKTTTLKTISGLAKPQKGGIQFLGGEIAGLAPNRIVRKGISQVPEGRQVFGKLSVWANLELGAYLEKNSETVKERMKRVESHFPRLGERRNQLAGTLSGGEQQMLAIGRALMGDPKLLLLDARAALHISDRAYVMETGKIVLEGPSQELLNHNQIRRAYLGKGYSEVWE
jgi:branched-chain amino acid transport system ATP-binding protein